MQFFLPSLCMYVCNPDSERKHPRPFQQFPRQFLRTTGRVAHFHAGRGVIDVGAAARFFL